MKKLLLLMLSFLVSPSYAATGWFSEYNYCEITGVSTASPAVVTLATTPSTCGLTNGAFILPHDVRGATIVNPHIKTAGATADLVRRVGTISGNTFTLMDADNNPVSGATHASCSGLGPTHAGNCAYSGGGRVALAYQVTLKAHPFLNFNPTDLARLVSTTGSGAAQTANPFYQPLIDMCNTRKAQADSEGVGMNAWGLTPMFACALKWKIDGDSTALAKAKWDLTHPWQLTGHSACRDEVYCGAAVSTQGDYPMHFFGEWYYNTYSLLRDQLTTGERSTIIDYFLKDRPWTQFGLGYTADSVSGQPYKINSMTAPYTSEGVITVANGSTAITCTGSCLWTTRMAAGDTISFPHGRVSDYPETYKIASVTNDNAAVLERGSNGAFTSATYQTAAAWNQSAGYGGFLFHQKHAQGASLNGGAGHMPYPSFPYGSSLPSPYYGVGGPSAPLSGNLNSVDGNASAMWVIGAFQMGTAFCEDDLRGCLLASQAQAIIATQLRPVWLNMAAGVTVMANVYTEQRGYDAIFALGQQMVNSWTGAPDIWAGTTLYKDYLRWHTASKVPGGRQAPRWSQAYPTMLHLQADRGYGVSIAMKRESSSVEAQNAKWTLLNELKLGTETGFITDGIQAVPAWYTHYDHTIVTAAAPAANAYMLTSNNASVCNSQYRAAVCNYFADTPRRFISSTAITSISGTHINCSIGGMGLRDHADAAGLIPHGCAIISNGELLLGGDSTATLGSERIRQGLVIPNFPTLTEGNGDAGTAIRWYPDTLSLPVSVEIGASRAFARQDLTALYTAAANVTAMFQDTIHVKPAGAQDFLVRRNTISTSVSQPVVSFAHLPLADAYTSASATLCGTPASSSCLPAVSGGVASNIKGSARLNVKMAAITSTQALLRTENGGSDFSYSGGAGLSGKIRMCPSSDGTNCLSATSHRWFEVYQANSNTATTMPATSVITSGSWDALQIEGSQPVVLIMNNAASLSPGATSTSSIATTHTGTAKYVVSGLSPGPYIVTGGSGGGCTVQSGEQTCEFSSTSGTISLSSSPGPTTSTIMRGVVTRGVTFK